MDTDIKTLKKELKNYRNLVLFYHCAASTKEKVECWRQLSIITQAVNILQLIPVHGEIYYKIIYYNYLAPEVYFYTFEILEALERDDIFLSPRTYYRYKSKALKLLSDIMQITL